MGLRTQKQYPPCSPSVSGEVLKSETEQGCSQDWTNRGQDTRQHVLSTHLDWSQARMPNKRNMCTVHACWTTNFSWRQITRSGSATSAGPRQHGLNQNIVPLGNTIPICPKLRVFTYRTCRMFDCLPCDKCKSPCTSLLPRCAVELGYCIDPPTPTPVYVGSGNGDLYATIVVLSYRA